LRQFHDAVAPAAKRAGVLLATVGAAEMMYEAEEHAYARV
jgi:hypothetical protein